VDVGSHRQKQYDLIISLMLSAVAGDDLRNCARTLDVAIIIDHLRM